MNRIKFAFQINDEYNVMLKGITGNALLKTTRFAIESVTAVYQPMSNRKKEA